MTLISAAEMAAIRSVGESGLVVEVAIYHGAITRTANGQEWAFPSTADVTTTGWLREMTGSGVKLDVIDGQTAISATFRLFLRVGTDCRLGDKVVINGNQYVVQFTNDDDTYPAFRVCWMRRQE